MKTTPLLELLENTPRNRIINFLLENIGSDYTKLEIAKYSGISRPTLYEVWDELVKRKIVKPTRKIGSSTLYTFNRESEEGRKYFEIMKMIMKESFAEAEAMAEKQKVVA